MYNSFQPYQFNYPFQNTYSRTETNNKIEIIKVNGENGAKSYPMPPNSSVLLLDETAPIIWLKTTDGASYPTLTPYKITPYKAEPPIDINSLENRIKKLEEIVKRGVKNDKSNNGNVKSKSNADE